jgi:aminopeptidase N
MLRGLMGDAAFFRGIRAYYLEHAHKTAATDDLRVALERASGMNLKEFFARWVYGSGHPRYEASWAWRQLRRARGMLTINLRQTQVDAPFLTPLPVEIVTAAGTKRMTIRPTGRESFIRIPLSGRPVDVRVDPDETILRELVVRQAGAQAAYLRRYSTQPRQPLSIRP